MSDGADKPNGAPEHDESKPVFVVYVTNAGAVRWEAAMDVGRLNLMLDSIKLEILTGHAKPKEEPRIIQPADLRPEKILS